VAVRAYTVSFVGPAGVRHSVDMTAESVYEAAALGLSRLQRDEWADQIARYFMDSIVVSVGSAISDEGLGAFVEQKGGYASGSDTARDWCVERGESAVWLSLEPRTFDQGRWIDRLNQDKIVLTVSRDEGSLPLAFELATEVADQWNGIVWCSEVPGWQEEYSSWLKKHRGA
jgi:hypothetical protein